MQVMCVTPPDLCLLLHPASCEKQQSEPADPTINCTTVTEQ